MGDGITLATSLQHYKRSEVQEGLLEAAKDREVAVKFGDRGFGKRPDTLQYTNDVFRLAQQGASSFHVSEELWFNPLQLDTGMKRRELDNLRKGWDLVLDVDCPQWELAKITTWLLIQALKDHGVGSISLKFSGNKGFHIGVPFESFPATFQGVQTRTLFPEAPRKIAQYLLDHINDKHITVEDNEITFGHRFRISLKQLQEITGKGLDELTTTYCPQCQRKVEPGAAPKPEFICPRCETRTKSDQDYMQCEKCGTLMEKIESRSSACKCGSDTIMKRFNPLSVIEVDTILIAPRHLYRAAYSMHEKSGLVSVPIPVDTLLDFHKEDAHPSKIEGDTMFLDRSSVEREEATTLLEKAYAHTQIDLREAQREQYEQKPFDAMEHFENAAPEEVFPCYIKQLAGPLEDGKKRALFVLTNFLGCVGWSLDDIDTFLHEWNDKHPEPLRETTIKGHLNYHKKHLGKVLPPNQDNKQYYSGNHTCPEDSMCRRIKNPVFYVRKRMQAQGKQGGKKSHSSK